MSQEQVRKDLSTVNQLTVPDRITGLDGKSRPARREPKLPPADVLRAARLATLSDGVRRDRQGASIEAPTQPEAAAMLNVSRPSVLRRRHRAQRVAEEDGL